MHRPIPALLCVVALAAAGSTACEEEQPAETQSFFELQKEAPAPAAQPQGQEGALPPGHPSVGGGEGRPVLTGRIQVADALKGELPKGVLFILARAPVEQGRGPALLVKRVTNPEFPYDFQLTTGDVMGQGAGLPERLVLEAHLDQDGDAISRTPGDLAGKIADPVATGTAGVEIVLDERVTEGKPGMKLGGGAEMPAGHPPVKEGERPAGTKPGAAGNGTAKGGE